LIASRFMGFWIGRALKICTDREQLSGRSLPDRQDNSGIERWADLELLGKMRPGNRLPEKVMEIKPVLTEFSLEI